MHLSPFMPFPCLPAARRWLVRAVAAASVAACSVDGAVSTPLTSVPPVHVTTDDQALKLVARSLDALFAYTQMNVEVLGAMLGPLPAASGARTATGLYYLPCVTGSAFSAFQDTDGSKSLTPGDVDILQADACRHSLSYPWTFGMGARMVIAAGSNLEPHLFGFAPGSATLDISHLLTPIGDSRTATGDFRFSSSKASSDAAYVQQLSIADLTIRHPDVAVRLNGVQMTVSDQSQVTGLGGFATTSVAGLGDVAVSLSLQEPLVTGTTTTRIRPVVGAVTLSANGVSILVRYAVGGTITIAVHHPDGGAPDRVVTTTEAELDSLLTVP